MSCRKSSVAALGSARPLVSFISAPTKLIILRALPFRYSATSFCCLARMASHIARSSPSSATTAPSPPDRPPAISSSGLSSPPTSSASTGFVSPRDSLPSFSSSSSSARRPGDSAAGSAPSGTLASLVARSRSPWIMLATSRPSSCCPGPVAMVASSSARCAASRVKCFACAGCSPYTRCSRAATASGSSGTLARSAASSASVTTTGGMSGSGMKR
mmetsp:Transcript_25617/g.65947  ORF Transcript_25617/g.65947 Transcript_25617/m.65947 type:complete len:216 (-) Transcript_25617:499-1146(-)